MSTLIVFIIVLAVLVLSHEFGHFVAARKSGMRVYEFGFGFPPRVFGVQRLTKKVLSETGEIKKIEKKWRWVWGRKEMIEETTPDGWQCGTLFSLNLIPIGGFVRIKGEEKESQDLDSFNMAKTWKKAIVIVAGVVMNIILAGILLAVGYGVGLPTMVDEMKDVSRVKDRKIIIMQILPDKPAEAAGLESGDTILKVGELTAPRLDEMQDYVDLHKDEGIVFSIQRGEEIFEKTIKPITYEESGRGGIGVGIAETGIVSYPWYSALWRGFVDSFLFLKAIIFAFFSLIVGLFVGKGGADAVSGPVGIAILAGNAAKMGFVYLIQFTAILSINLAVINILPLPALDGGRLLFLLLNKFKKINFAKYEQTAHTVGFILLLLLLAMVTVRDIGSFKGVFIEFFKKIF